MKTFIASLILFLSVSVFVTVNTVFHENTFESIGKKLDSLPDTPQKIEKMSEGDAEKYKKELTKIEKEWKKREEYIYVTLEHNVAARFTEYFLPTKEYFVSQDYPSYLASLKTVKDIVKQFETNESVSLENIF